MKALLIYLQFVLLILVINANDPPTLLNSMKQRFVRTENVDASAKSNERGYVTCACGKLMNDLLRTIYFLRVEWKSRYPISVMHCNELSSEHKQLIEAMDEYGNITPTNICGEPYNNFGVHPQRLRGFFCKVAAVLASPYDNTLLIDLDLAWLRSPDLLFESRLFQKTGALFFRDRILHGDVSTEVSGKPNGRMEDFVRVFTSMNIQLNSTYVQAQFYSNGVSPWWRCLGPFWPEDIKPKACYGETQDSSMVLINKRQHPGMMKMLQRLLPSFETGYGDKEIYWIAATLANEPFTLSPFAAGQYGDCSGQILQYFPDDIFLLSNSPNVSSASLRRLKPFYINAEYIVEKGDKLTAVGAYFQRHYVVAQLFHDSRTMKNVTTDVLPHNFCYNKPHFVGNCTCETHDCLPISPWMSHQLAYHQWVSLALQLDRQLTLREYYEQHQQMPYCIPVLVTTMAFLNSVFHHHAANIVYQRYFNPAGEYHVTPEVQALHNTTTPISSPSVTRLPHSSHWYAQESTQKHGFDPQNCILIGCPVLPIDMFDHSLRDPEIWSPGFGRFCEPVRFSAPTRATVKSHNVAGASSESAWNMFPIPVFASANHNNHQNTHTAHNKRSSAAEATTATTNSTVVHPHNSFIDTPIAGYQNQSLLSLAKQWRKPRDLINAPHISHSKQLMKCPGRRSIYQYSEIDHFFHEIPNWTTFLKLGLDLSDVAGWNQVQCEMVRFGHTLPSLG